MGSLMRPESASSQSVLSRRFLRSPKHARQPLAVFVAQPDKPLGMRSTMYRHLGAHVTEREGIVGTHFAVWAPNAREVSLICNSNGWQPGQHQLRGSNEGIWSIFMPGLGPGEVYKYSLIDCHGNRIEKSDPYAFQSELRPKTASVVCDLGSYEWNDAQWLAERAQTNWLEQPISIYEVHLGSWRKPTDGRLFYSYSELADMLIEYCTEMGYTHLQLMPVTEHPFDGSWGYQVTGYFSPTSRFGEPQDFMQFVDKCHQAGLAVLVDWVPAHFPTDPHALGQFDGTALYEHADPRRGFHPDWNTLIFNYGRFEVRDFLLSSARFWCEHYHVDGLRVDAVASMLYLDYSRPYGEWLPNDQGGRENWDAINFFKDANTMIHGEFPGVVTIAEESTAWPGVSRPVYTGGLGFTMKWDMGWMNDSLRYMRREPIFRQHHQGELSFRMVYAFHENFVLPLSHDEVVHGKRSLISQMPGDDWQQFANLRLLYSYQFASVGKKLLFMGGELAQWLEWNHDTQIDWPLLEFDQHKGIQRLLTDLNRVYREQRALYEQDFQSDGFQWIQCDDWQHSTYAFIRWAKDRKEAVVCVLNMTPVVRYDYRIGVPARGFYKEIFNSDATIYGGSGVGNQGGRYSEATTAHGFDNSVAVTLPPLGAVMLKIIGSTTAS